MADDDGLLQARDVLRRRDGRPEALVPVGSQLLLVPGQLLLDCGVARLDSAAASALALLPDAWTSLELVVDALDRQGEQPVSALDAERQAMRTEFSDALRTGAEMRWRDGVCEIKEPIDSDDDHVAARSSLLLSRPATATDAAGMAEGSLPLKAPAFDEAALAARLDALEAAEVLWYAQQAKRGGGSSDQPPTLPVVAAPAPAVREDERFSSTDAPRPAAAAGAGVAGSIVRPITERRPVDPPMTATTTPAAPRVSRFRQQRMAET